MASTGNIFPTAAVNVDRAGNTAWTNPGNVVSDNATDATVAVPADYLVTSGYGFAIPSTAIILGVTVRVEASETGSGSSSYIPQLHSDTTPTLIGSAKSAITVTGTTKVISTSGGSADLWGAALTPAIVNAAGFGVSIWSTDTTNTLAIDFVTIAIEYQIQQSHSEFLGATETLQRTVTRTLPGETVGLSENLTTQQIAAHFGTRTRYSWELFDDETRQPGAGEVGEEGAVGDTLGLSETLDAEVNAAPIVEPFDLEENLLASRLREAATSDTTAFSELLTAQAIMRGKSARPRRFAYIFFDDEPRIGVAVQTGSVSDTLGAEESLDIQVNKYFADTVDLFTETVQRSLAKALNDTIGLAENDAYATAHAIIDNVGLNEELTAVKISEPSLGIFIESVQLGEKLNASITRRLEEDLVLNEDQAIAVARATADNLTTSEFMTRDLSRNINEPVMTLSEALDAVIARTTARADTVSLTEVLTAILVTLKSVADTLGLTESLLAQRLAYQLSHTYSFDALFCTQYDFDALFTNEIAVEALF